MLTRSLRRPSGAGAAVVPGVCGPTASAGRAHTLRVCPPARSYTHSRNGLATGAAARSAQKPFKTAEFSKNRLVKARAPTRTYARAHFTQIRPRQH